MTELWPFAAIVFIMLLGYYTGRKSDGARESAAKEKAEAERRRSVDELEFVGSAAALLPDIEASLTRLKQRYTWNQLVSAAHYTENDLELIERAAEQATVELPNFAHPSPGYLERDALSKARVAAKTLGLFGSIGEAEMQQPTTQTLKLLVEVGVLECTPAVDAHHRSYQVSLSAKGLHIHRLSVRFRDPSGSIPSRFMRSTSQRDAISRVVRSAFNART